MSIGERIKARRKEIGMSAEQVADKLGVSPATIYRYESNDIANMRIDKLEPIAEVLHTTPAYLMGWEEESPASIKNDELSQKQILDHKIKEIFSRLSEQNKEIALSQLDALLKLQEQKKNSCV